MDIKDRKKSYSDLEAIVIPSESSSSSIPSSSSASHIPAGRISYWNEKILAEPSVPEPLPNRYAANTSASVSSSSSSSSSGNGKKVIGGIDSSSPIDTLPPPPPAYYLVDSKGQTQALYTVPTNSNGSSPSDTDSVANFKSGGGYNASMPPPPSGGWWKSMGQGKRILGMRKNVFLAVCAGLCALILGLLMTILLVTRTIPIGGHPGVDGKMRPAAFSTLQLLTEKDQNNALLSATNLASMNWTDTSTGTPYTGVFYQSSRATGMSLMAAIKNEQTLMWTSINISASAGGGAPLDVLDGTPIAAASNNGLWNLIYLSSIFGLQEIYSTNPTSTTGWLKGEMASKLGFPTVVPGSGLAAMWQSCSNCNNSLFVMWQDSASGSIVYANETNLTWGNAITLSDSGAPGATVAVSAFTDFNGTASTGSDKNAVRFYYENGDGLYETMKGPLGGQKLAAGNFGEFAISPPPTCERLKLE